MQDIEPTKPKEQFPNITKEQDQVELEKNITKKDQDSQKGFGSLYILIILLTAILAGGAVWLYYQYKILPDLQNQGISCCYSKKQTSVQTSPATESEQTKDWKVYENTRQKITVKYPKDWATTEFIASQLKKIYGSDYGPNAGASTELIFFGKSEIKKFTGTYPQGTIWLNITKSTDLPKGAGASLAQPAGMEVAKQTDVESDNIKGIKYIGESENDIVYVFFTRNTKYMLGISGTPNANSAEILNNIITTIKFS